MVQLFGWKHATTGLRRFRRVHLEVARKNAKSTLAAGIALYLLVADGELGAHLYSAATTGEQAREVFDFARDMALRLPEFQARVAIDIGRHDIAVAAAWIGIAGQLPTDVCFMNPVSAALQQWIQVLRMANATKRRPGHPFASSYCPGCSTCAARTSKCMEPILLRKPRDLSAMMSSARLLE